MAGRTALRGAAAALLLGAAASGPAWAATIEVRPGESIQAAVDRANDGDTVAVRAGTYDQTVYVRGKSRLRLVSADGRGAAHIRSGGTPLFVQGGDRNEVRGFALSAGRNGNGLQVGGAPGDGDSRFATNFVVAENDIVAAGLDAIKAHQMVGLRLLGNRVENAGQAGGANLDGGIDFVAVRDSLAEGNVVVETGGNTCFLIKGGSSGNVVRGNSLGGCKDAVHVGGSTGRKYFPTGVDVEAFDNLIEGNDLCGTNTAVFWSKSVGRGHGNVVSGNRTGGCTSTGARGGAAGAVGGTAGGGAALDDEDLRDVEAALRDMRGRGLGPEEMDAEFRAAGYLVGRDVLTGRYDVAEGNRLGLVSADVGDAAGGGAGRAWAGSGGGGSGGAGFDPVDAFGTACSVGSMVNGAMAAGSVIGGAGSIAGTVGGIMSGNIGSILGGLGGMFGGGGRATAKWQQQQQIQLTFQSICDAHRAMLQARTLAPLAGNPSALAGALGIDVWGALDEVASEVLGQVFHDGASEGIDWNESLGRREGLRTHADEAARNALAVSAANRAASRRLSQMADEAVRLGVGAEGPTAAAQANMHLARIRAEQQQIADVTRAAYDHAALVRAEEGRASELLVLGRRVLLYRDLGALGAGAGFDLFQ